VLTGSLPDVLGGDPDPAVAIRLRDHRLEQPAIRLLRLAPPPKLGLRLTQPHGEPIANPLKLGDAEDPRAPHRRYAPFDPRPWKRRREQLAEALFEQCDLPAELLPHPSLGCRIGNVGG
jgi:hypothetical protein